jgi:hypothetical protein
MKAFLSLPRVAFGFVPVKAQADHRLAPVFRRKPPPAADTPTADEIGFNLGAVLAAHLALVAIVLFLLKLAGVE